MATNVSSSPQTNAWIRVRPFVAEDRPFVLSLAPRLVLGIARWRDHEMMLATAQGWLAGSMERHGTETIVFIAEDERGERLGCASVSHSHHFTGDRQAYIGELAVSDTAEGHGVGRALVLACEQWAREQGYPFLVLATGSANAGARGFYQHLGFQEEDVTLVKLLTMPH